MPFPFAVLGLLVVVAASTVAWICDTATEKEREHHKELERERDNLVETLHGIQEAGDTSRNHEFKRMAQQFSAHVRQMLNDKETEQKGVKIELTTMWEDLHKELTTPHLNSWRRRTLLMRVTQIEDAIARVMAHEAYRKWYFNQLNDYWLKGLYEEITKLEIPSATVPTEWLYVGKVVRVAQYELDRWLTYGQRLRLNRDFIRSGQGTTHIQEQLMLNYHDMKAIPIQIISYHENHNWFSGCIGRGILHADYIDKGLQTDLLIEKITPNGCIGSLMEGTIQALLPLNRIAEPGLRPMVGAQLDVWPELYDLCLQYTPGTEPNNFGKKYKQIKVTNRPPAGATQQRQLALAIGDGIGYEERLIHVKPEAWRVVYFDETQDRLDILNEGLSIHCRIDHKRGMLIANQIQTISNGIEGLAIPLYIEPIDARLANDTLLQWHEGLANLYSFALQNAENPQRQELRQVQVQFLKRWDQVVDYQIDQEMYQSLTFTAQAISYEDDELELINIEDGEGDLVKWRKDWNKALKDSEKYGKQPHRTLKLWLPQQEEGEAGWITLLKNRSGQSNVEVTLENDIDIVVRFRVGKNQSHIKQLCENKPNRYCLTLELQRGDLVRQKKALRDFGEDRMVEPVLKELLLTPQYYRPVNDRDWQQRIKKGLPWSNSLLTKVQCEVIETCLANPHLTLVQGPPGTAKTTCIVEILHQLFTAQPGARVLVVSQQNAAVDNALDRFIKDKTNLHLFNGENPAVRLMRIGHEDKIIDSLKSYSLDATLNRRIKEWSEIAYLCRVHEENSLLRQSAEQWLVLLQDYQRMQVEEHWKTVDDEFTVALLQGHNLIGATCVGLATTHMGLDQLQFDLAIIDEAGRATLPELLIPVLRAKKVILIGDHFQLPPAVAPLLREEKTQEELPFLDRAFLETSFFEHLFNSLPRECKAKLTEQYRMAEPIGNLVADMFYSPGGERSLFNGKITPRPEAQKPLSDQPLLWMDIRGKQKQRKDETSQFNMEEVIAISEFLEEMVQRALTESTVKEVAVITPYGAQKNEIIKALRLLKSYQRSIIPDDGKAEMYLGPLHVRVDTVDGFQGSEAHLVCYSTVRTHGSLRFLLDKKRLNVACSRARENLVFFGDADFLGATNTKNSRENLVEHNYFLDIIACAKKIIW